MYARSRFSHPYISEKFKVAEQVERRGKLRNKRQTQSPSGRSPTLSTSTTDPTMSTAFSTPEQSVFVPKTPVKHAATIGLQAGAVGVFVSAIQNALDKHSRGASGFLTRTGGTIGFFGEPHVAPTTSFILILHRIQRQWELHSLSLRLL